MADERAPRICRREDSILLVVDVQERLAARMHPDARQMVLRNLGILLRAAARLGIPRFLTEQYPKGLGRTDPAVASHLGDDARRFEKTSFSCLAAEGFRSALHETGRRQVVLAGMEAHVCVLQTALELHAEGYEVYVVEDGICSRAPSNHRNAAHRLGQAGVLLANTESVVFEWLRDSRHEHFKAISAVLR